MPRRKSTHVCRRCGLALTWIARKGGTEGWRHAAGATTQKACGQEPLAVPREEYEQEHDELAQSARDFMRITFPWR